MTFSFQTAPPHELSHAVKEVDSDEAYVECTCGFVASWPSDIGWCVEEYAIHTWGDDE